MEFELDQRSIAMTMHLILIGVLSALGMTNHPKVAMLDIRFWRGFLKLEGIIGIMLCLAIIAIGSAVRSIWILETTPRSFYPIWNAIDIPLHLGFILVLLILGILVGRRYRIAVETGEFKRSTHFLTTNAVIGSIPFLLSLTIVLCSRYYRQNGLFYSHLDRTHITSVEWASEVEIKFRLTNYHVSDCVGCDPIRYCDYKVDLNSSIAQEISCGEFELSIANPVSTRNSQPIPSERETLLSPDGNHAAYVVKDYDLYVKPANSSLFSRRALYQYPSSGFFGRYQRELTLALIYALPVGAVLMGLWGYSDWSQPYARRVTIAVIVWNVAFFAGSLLTDRSVVNLHTYLWATIP